MVLDLRGSAPPKGLNCPHCHVALSMASREGIEIDFCPQCRGIWLDRGELDKIIERSIREVPSEPVRTQSYRDDDDRHDYKRRKKYKKKSWIAEIFDELT